MSAALILPDLATPEAFVAWVAEQPMKYEMAGGRLVMMAGGSNRHMRIAVNLISALSRQLRGGPCLPNNSDFMVEITSRDRFYPDASVSCGEVRDFTDRPVLVVEVLSPSTRRFDLTYKLPAYLTKSGLRHVLFLESDRAKALLWLPGETPADEPIEVLGLDGVITLDELGVTLTMRELYEDVAFA